MKFNRAQRRAMQKLARAKGMHKFAADINRICDGLENEVFNKPPTKQQQIK